ncbi:MAG: hypothetical protein KAQ92_03565 [Candidatus Aenigmarchaeota archaeon]|nr:hypothetical protein [Candidatus Aenigmarchaeota archaeon]
MASRRKAVLSLSLEQIISIIGMVLFAIIAIPIFVKIVFNTESAMGSWSEEIIGRLSGFAG